MHTRHTTPINRIVYMKYRLQINHTPEFANHAKHIFPGPKGGRWIEFDKAFEAFWAGHLDVELTTNSRLSVPVRTYKVRAKAVVLSGQRRFIVSVSWTDSLFGPVLVDAERLR